MKNSYWKHFVKFWAIHLGNSTDVHELYPYGSITSLSSLLHKSIVLTHNISSNLIRVAMFYEFSNVAERCRFLNSVDEKSHAVFHDQSF